MSNFILMIFCFVAGVFLRKSGKLPPQAHQVLNTIVIYLALPALALLYIPQLVLSHEIAIAALMPWMLFVIGALFFYAIGRAFRLPRQTVAALTLVGGLGNTSFVGVPLIEALHGKSGIPLALVIDQAGTYLVLSTAGMVVVSLYSAERSTLRSVVGKVVTFPPFIALCVGALLIGVRYPPWIEGTLQRLGDLVAPLALISVGYQIRLSGIGDNARALAAGLGYKLVICPVLVIGAFALLGLPTTASASHVILLESAMGPQIGAGVVATQNGLNPQLVTLMLGIGIPLSVLTVVLWYTGLRWFSG